MLQFREYQHNCNISNTLTKVSLFQPLLGAPVIQQKPTPLRL